MMILTSNHLHHLRLAFTLSFEFGPFSFLSQTRPGRLYWLEDYYYQVTKVPGLLLECHHSLTTLSDGQHREVELGEFNIISNY